MKEQSSGNAFLRRRAVRAKLGVSDTTLRRWEADGRFPKCRRLGPRVCGWLASEIDTWLAARSEGPHAA